ncbi:MAG: nucleotidyltransferase domain-containing protein [Candidatus Latescibacterota bacterium]
MATTLPISPEAMGAYRATARQRLAQERPRAALRREQAWILARSLATLLRERFGASRVAVFGSLVHEDCFTPWSDLDLAVWGLRPEDAFRALGVAMDMGGPIAVDLVDADACRPALRAAIEEEGVEV